MVSSTPYHNVHRRGSDSRQGTLLLEAGTLLRAPEIAVAASAGMARVRVSSQPAVMVVSTGDELIEPGDPIAGFPGAPLECLRGRRHLAPTRLSPASATITCWTMKTCCASV